MSRTVIEFKETLIIDFILIFSLYLKRINDFFRNELEKKTYEDILVVIKKKLETKKPFFGVLTNLLKNVYFKFYGYNFD